MLFHDRWACTNMDIGHYAIFYSIFIHIYNVKLYYKNFIFRKGKQSRKTIENSPAKKHFQVFLHRFFKFFKSHKKFKMLELQVVYVNIPTEKWRRENFEELYMTFLLSPCIFD